MQNARQMMSGSDVRGDAKKVVVVLTDGVPTLTGTFSPQVANDAVQSAKVLKDAGSSVYSIGIFGGADTRDVNENTSTANRIMQALSSNYPNAVSYGKSVRGRPENTIWPPTMRAR